MKEIIDDVFRIEKELIETSDEIFEMVNERPMEIKIWIRPLVLKLKSITALAENLEVKLSMGGPDGSQEKVR